jgi:hypothetical protein
MQTFSLCFFLVVKNWMHLLLLAEQLLGKMQCLTGVGKLIKFSQTNFTHSSLGFSLSGDISLQVKSELTDDHIHALSNVNRHHICQAGRYTVPYLLLQHPIT